MMPNPMLQYDLVKAHQRELMQEAERARLAQAARVERPRRAAPALRRLHYALVTMILWLKTLG
jgi:hypothetical protein